MNGWIGVSRLCMAFSLFICVTAWSDSPTVAEIPRTAKPKIALIIDDLGNMLKNGDRTVALDGPVACAVLPHTPHAVRLADRAHAAGKEVLLHLPLQSVQMFEATSLGVIQVDTTQPQLARILAIDLASVPHVVGVNNHQGSLLTQHPGHMNWLMAELQTRGDLFFVDSFTSDASVALQLARENGVPSIRRHVFLDSTPTHAAIDAEFRRLKKLARSRGIAVGIGHPYTVTLDYLEQAIPALRAEGYELVSVSRAIVLDGQPAVQTASLDRQGIGR